MKQHIEGLLEQALKSLTLEGVLQEAVYNILLERPKQREHGDFATNLALVLAKEAKLSPRVLAEKIVLALPSSELVQAVTIAGPGFINFTMVATAEYDIIETILQKGSQFGRCTQADPQKINVEFVSANPTGPLHVGHGRGAAYGSAVASLLSFVGHKVHTEYYVNDAGRQMDILATSIWLRYLTLCGEIFDFPQNGYRGGYVVKIAEMLQEKFGNSLQSSAAEVFLNVCPDEGEKGGDKEKHIDGLIANAKSLLRNHYQTVHQFGLQVVLDEIKEDLDGFRVTFDRWFSEKSLHESGQVQVAIEALRSQQLIYEKQGATWFLATSFGDEKDRVIVRENGQPTYFAADTAYIRNKAERGYDQLIYIFGADHHGYIPRLKALATAFGFSSEKVYVPLVQFATLYRQGKPVQMSTRSGSFVTLRELYDEVGTDAARFFYLMRKCEQHLDFDLDLAKSQSNENPVYYIQYAHARICSVLRLAKEKVGGVSLAQGLAALRLLEHEYEQALMKKLATFPEMILKAADRFEPHQVTYYLRELAQMLHAYYNSQQILVADSDLCQSRLALLAAVRQVLHNGLTLLGLTAPESM